MKFKKNEKMKPKVVESKSVIEECFYMIPAAVTVRELAQAVHCVTEESKEIWTELDLMEIVLAADSLVFENMMDTFTESGDAEFLEEKGIRTVYAASYDTRDKVMVKKVLEELYAAFGGFMASDTEDLEPVFEIADF